MRRPADKDAVTLPGYTVAGLRDYLATATAHREAHRFDREAETLIEMSGYLQVALDTAGGVR